MGNGGAERCLLARLKLSDALLKSLDRQGHLVHFVRDVFLGGGVARFSGHALDFRLHELQDFSQTHTGLTAGESHRFDSNLVDRTCHFAQSRGERLNK